MTQPQDEQLRVVIDNSVLIAILRHRDPGNNWLIQLWRSGRIVPLASQETLHELEQKLLEHSPTPKEYPAMKFVASAMRRYEPWCERVEPQDNTLNPKCDDPDDQKFVDLAFAGNANVQAPPPGSQSHLLQTGEVAAPEEALADVLDAPLHLGLVLGVSHPGGVGAVPFVLNLSRDPEVEGLLDEVEEYRELADRLARETGLDRRRGWEGRPLIHVCGLFCVSGQAPRTPCLHMWPFLVAWEPPSGDGSTYPDR